MSNQPSAMARQGWVTSWGRPGHGEGKRSDGRSLGAQI